MNIGFFIGEMNFRGVSNSTYQYAYFNQIFLKNNSIIFFNKLEKFHKKEVIDKFKKKFKVIGVNGFKEVDKFIERLNLKYIYVQKGGQRDRWIHFNDAIVCGFNRQTQRRRAKPELVRER